MTGLTLILSVNYAAPVTITFTGTNPLNLSQVLSQINAVLPGFATESISPTGNIIITSPTVGTGSSILASGTSLSTLGFSSVLVDGLGGRPLLIDPTIYYDFVDLGGDTPFYYKTCFYSSSTGAVSSFSTPQVGYSAEVLPSTSLSTMTVYLCDISGAPLLGRRIIFIPLNTITTHDGSGNDYGILPSVDRLEVVTNQIGFATTTLVIGATLRVFFEGSSYFRDFVVPNVASFDLLSIISASPDPLGINVAPPLPIRTS